MPSIRPIQRGGHPCIAPLKTNRFSASGNCSRPEPDPNTADREGRTPLHLAVQSDSPETVHYLLEAKAAPNAADKDGATALHYAASNRSPDVTQRLLDAGADPNTADREGRTPIDVAPATRFHPDRERVARGPRTTAGARS